MSAIGGPGHEVTLDAAIQELEGTGWRVVRLDGKSPDAIAVKEGRIVAVEVLGQRHRRGKGWRADGTTFQGKRVIYAMFDDVLFFTFHYPPP